MSAIPDFLAEDQAEVAPPALDTLVPLIALFKEQKAEVDRLTNELELATAALTKTSREEIPEIMNFIGYREITLANKEKVKVKEDASVSVPEDKETEFFKFLADRGDQAIIKTQFAFPRMSGERRQLLFDLLEANEFEDYEFKEGVHPQTLKAYFKKLLGVGEEDRAEGIRIGKYLHPDKVTGFTKVFTYFVTSITDRKSVV